MKHLQKFERYFDLNDPVGKQPTYDIIYEFGKPKAIHCNVCNMTSHNLTDLEKKYCANCDMFHEDTEPAQRISPEDETTYPSDMYFGKGPSDDEDEEEDDEDLESEEVEGELAADILDDLKTNFGAWKTDCDNQECFDKICNIMSDRHPNVEPDEIATICSEWIGFDLGIVEKIKSFDNFLNEAKKEKKEELTYEKKKKVLKHFLEWSEGNDPTEMHWEMDGEDDDPGLAFFLDDNFSNDKKVKEWFEQLHDGDKKAVAEMKKIIKDLEK